MSDDAGVQRFQVELEPVENNVALTMTIPFDVREVFGTRARVPVVVTIKGVPQRGSIFPMGGGRHYMVVNAAMREAWDVKAGDVVEVEMARDDEPRVITPPPDLQAALDASPAALAAWEKLSYTHRREHVQAIVEAKAEATRKRRIEKAIAMLEEGKKPR